MKKSTIIVIVVIVLIAIWGITSYNGMVKMDESVSTAWSNVENQYQRRSDLIPNLVNTVKGYASHEKETFQAVVDARSKATQMQISADDLTPEKMQAYQKAQGEVGSALSRLLAITDVSYGIPQSPLPSLNMAMTFEILLLCFDARVFKQLYFMR